MPFKSERQRKFLFSQKPKVAREFARKEKNMAGKKKTKKRTKKGSY